MHHAGLVLADLKEALVLVRYTVATNPNVF